MRNAKEITKNSRRAGIAKKKCVSIATINICHGSYGIKVWLNEHLDCGRRKNLVQGMAVDDL